MSRRTFIQRKQNKCNFCHNWFESTCKLQSCIHLCHKCVSQYPDSIMIHFPDDQFIKYVRSDPLHQAEQIMTEEIFLVQSIDPSVKQLNQKWGEITKNIQNGTKKQFSKLNNLLDSFILMRDIDTQSEESFVINDSFQIEARTSVSLLQILDREQNKENRRVNVIPNRGISKKKISNDKFRKNSLVKKGTSDVIPFQKQKDTQLKQQIIEKTKSKNRIPMMKPITNRNPLAKCQKQQLSLNLIKQKKYETKKIQQLRSPRKLKQITLQSKNLKQKITQYLQKGKQIPSTKVLQMTNLIHDAITLKTQRYDNYIAIATYPLNQLQIKCYLNVQTWTGIRKLRLINVGLDDKNFKLVLDFIKDKEISCLNLTSNHIKDESLYYLLNEMINLPFLKHVYLNNNYINQKIICAWEKLSTNNFTIHFK